MDESAQPDLIEMRPDVIALQVKSFELLKLGPGDRFLDDVDRGNEQALGQLIRAQIRTIGVDTDPAVVTSALAFDPNAPLNVAPADRLPLKDGTLDGYRTSPHFPLISDLRATLVEARRVLRPGGRIVLVGPDYGFFLMDSDDHDLTDVIGLGLESRLTFPRAARSYRNVLLDVGFSGAQVDVHTEVITDYQRLSGQLKTAAEAAVTKSLITRGEANSWLTEQVERGHRDRFFAVLPTLLVAASR
ncbi:methyltransferase domain-containing protein [Kribbella italica]|uniref:SAM-dependent methyltransferase n=1 Tax=Kribbella italica TaxID=1540520 RepID=A0A7W9JGE9_9ACTN|nr:methyltransferase domain-containing protein [Kribbella italica]MBB5841628.1 SAM-dependent methyltransferase [Kribbella italica]